MPFLVLDPAVAAAAPAVAFGAPEAVGQHPAGKSLLAMRTRLRLELGNRTDITDAQLDEWINDGYQDLYSDLRLPESTRSYGFNTVVDQPLYLIPPTVDTIRALSATDPSFTDTGAPFEQIDLATYRKLPVRTGPPEYFFRDQSMLVLWPTPDDAYPTAVDVRIKPAKLTADAHYPILEDKWHEVLFKAAKYRGWEGLQNDTKALLTENQMAKLVGRKNDRDSEDRQSMYPAMRPIMSRRDLMSLRRNPKGLEPGDGEL